MASIASRGALLLSLNLARIGHVCGRVLLSGFEAGLGSRQRAEAVDKAAQSATLLMDKSHWGILRVEGQDRLRFLHSQGTNAFEDASNGEARCFA